MIHRLNRVYEFRPEWVSGVYYSVHDCDRLNTSGAAPAAGTVYYLPLFVYRRTRINRISVNCSADATPDANSEIKIDLYSSRRGKPYQLIRAGAAKAVTVALISDDITGGLSLKPGVYWLGMRAKVSDLTFDIVHTQNNADGLVGIASGAGDAFIGYNATLAYATAAPATPPTLTATNANTAFRIMVRAS